MTATQEDVKAEVTKLLRAKVEPLKLRKDLGLTNAQVRGLVTDLNEIVVRLGGVDAVTADEAEDCETIGDVIALVADKVLS